MNLIAGVNSDYNTMVWKTYKNVSAIDLNTRSFAGTNTGDIGFVPTTPSCTLGTIYAGS